uniref:CAZy families GH62/GH43 protein n=1 Tax=uncultured Opitutus sp. TaxID=296825 RepID=A0A060CHZ5_9BACT|nr:CAZy families GH62/GH43 protein [uncultured Opitutus sp.]
MGKQLAGVRHADGARPDRRDLSEAHSWQAGRAAGDVGRFTAATLGLQWQWNHNPDNTKWSLTERAGHLRLRPTAATSFWTARNTLTQKARARAAAAW